VQQPNREQRPNDRKPMGPGDYVIAAMFGAVILVVAAGVFWRYVLGNPLTWTVEASRILFSWMVFVGAALAIKEGTHIRVSLLADRLPASGRKWLAVGYDLLTAALLGVLVWYGVEYARMAAGSRTSALGLSEGYVWYTALPVPLAVGIYYAVRRAIAAWRKPPDEAPTPGEM
jgi:TRAP-type C4-dicarboxylate transport system permease small subunit